MRPALIFIAGFGWWPVASAMLALASAVAIAWRRDRAAWVALGALILTAAAVVALRFLASSTPGIFASIDLIKPSGHSAMAAIAYGTIGLVLGRHLPPALRHPARVVCLALVPAVPAAMVLLALHTPADVIVGSSAGLAAMLAGPARSLVPRPAPARTRSADRRNPY